MKPMNIKKIIASGAILACLTTPAWADSINYNIVEFSESASVRVPNDTMNVVLRITENGKSRQNVSNAVTRRLNAVLARAQGNKDFEVESGNRHTYPEYGDNHKIIGWSDSAEIRITSQAFDALNKLIADSQNDAMIDHISFSVSAKNRAKAVEEASEQALKAFQTRAKNVSKTLGFSQYKIVHLNLNQSFSTQVAQPKLAARMATYANADAAEVMQTSAGIAEIRQTVQGSIQIQ